MEKLLRSGGGSRYVVVEYDEISQEAWLEAALLFFLIFSEGGGLRVGIDCFVQSDFFLRLVGFGSGLVLASNGSVEATEWINGLYGIVGAEGQDYVMVEKRTPGVGVFHPLGAQTGFGPVHVCKQVRGLH